MEYLVLYKVEDDDWIWRVGGAISKVEVLHRLTKGRTISKRGDMPKLTGLTVMSLCIAVATTASAQMLRNDPNRPVGAISADLGVTAGEFIVCFHDVNPERRGAAPSAARQRANKAILLPCLQKANPSITNDMLDRVMDRHRPG
ncbi:MAG: hypothetical protein O7B25_05595 [Gammaproteobacteria bacterium]|nr:hypothetical protein [Gammaproteobacteria bacterium]